MDFILADKDKKELGQVELDMDMDIGGTNDYQFSVSLSQWEDLYSQVAYIYIPDTEYGGPVSTPETVPASNTVRITGDIWRKMLSQKIIERRKAALTGWWLVKRMHHERPGGRDVPGPFCCSGNRQRHTDNVLPV